MTGSSSRKRVLIVDDSAVVRQTLSEIVAGHPQLEVMATANDPFQAAERLKRVLWNDPGTGVMRHADAGYEIAKECAREQGLDLPMLD